MRAVAAGGIGQLHAKAPLILAAGTLARTLTTRRNS